MTGQRGGYVIGKARTLPPLNFTAAEVLAMAVSLAGAEATPFASALRKVLAAAPAERDRRLGANLLTRLLDRRIDPQAAQLQLAELGLDLAECVLIAARTAGTGSRAPPPRRGPCAARSAAP